MITSAGIVAWTIGYLHESEAASGGLGGSELPAPQGVLMGLVIDGVLQQNLPWSLILIGAVIAGAVAALRIPALPFAVGLYLPLYTMAAVFLGGLARLLMTRRVAPEEAERRREQGVLVGSGMVGGEGLTGVLLAIWVVAFNRGGAIEGFGLAAALGLSPVAADVLDQGLAVAAVLAILWLLFRFARRRLG